MRCVLRDSDGVFVFGFVHRLEPSFALEAELWSLYHGISLAWGRGFTSLEVETDSQQATDIMVDNQTSSHSLDQI